ncbi:MAG: Eco57I restriction-modification methylase domain-containing protein, partial [Chloroflexi bacterium]|nr:Eco57I restriction-modification methylase domain-containing protein [Chloroflexota bacterium]
RGRLGFILPHKFFNSKYGEPLRGLIAEGRHLAHVVHFGDQQVFDGAITYTTLMFLDKAGNEQFEVVKVSDLAGWRETRPLGSGETLRVLTAGTIPASAVTAAEWNFTVGKGAALFERLSQMPVKLGDIAHIFVGLQTSADTVFLFKDTPTPSKKLTKVYSKELDQEVSLESGLLKPVVRSGEIGRYWATPTAHVLFPYYVEDGKAKLISETEMERAYPKTWEYLLKNKQLLANREHGKFKASGWYQLYPKNLDLWEQPKILTPYMITDLAAYPDKSDIYFVNVTTGGFGITIEESHGELEYFTSLLNSHLLDWFLKQVSTTFHGGYFAANKQFLVQLPIRPINFSDPADKARHDKMVQLVESMLALHKHRAAARTQAEQEQIQRQIDATDRKIDALVYELYGLTAEEIGVVEERG